MISIFLMIYDAIAISSAYFVALWGRFDFVFSKIPPEYLSKYRKFILPYAAACVVVFICLKLYRYMWRYAGYSEFIGTFTVSALTSMIHAGLITIIFGRMPMTYYLWGGILQFILLIAVRFSYRLIRHEMTRRAAGNKGNVSNVMVIGAGEAGQMIIKSIIEDENSGDRVVCIIDDNPNKWGRYIDGVEITGGRDDILASVEKFRVDKIYFAIPSATADEKREILNICGETDCELKQLPGIRQVISGQVTVSAMKKVSVEDLLGREPINSDLNEVFEFINGKTVLVTGGGGSIGSELCRQIAAHRPKRLIIFDIYENNAYSIQLELKEKYQELDLVTLIGSVRDSRRLYDVFTTYRPDIVYHAAAHKHVPLMEDSPCEAIKNNAFGTYKTAYAAMACGCKRFVLISTDKAVNPTNIMGASKRLCEMIIQCFDEKIKAGKVSEIPQLFTHYEDGDVFPLLGENVKTEFVAVRFGNVLGSNGSVVPLFKKQIERGGPVTVTHPDIIRYFMTIPEAVSLVLLAGTYANGGEIFVLDMGNPIKIDTLARNLIKLSGFRPDVDIKIEYTGLRPGEKLYEEKLMAEEGLQTTDNDRIHVGRPISFDKDRFLSSLKELENTAYENSDGVYDTVEKLVPSYKRLTGQTAEGIHSEQKESVPV